MNASIPVRENRWLLIAVTTLAATQGLLGVLRAFAWARAGAKLAGQGIPLIDILAYGVGKLILATALLYFIFAAGTFLGKGWGWWSGLHSCFVKWIARVGCFQGRRAHRGAYVLARSSCHPHLLPVFSFWATTRFTILMKAGGFKRSEVRVPGQYGRPGASSQKPPTRKSGKEIQELSRILKPRIRDIRFVRRDVIE